MHASHLENSVPHGESLNTRHRAHSALGSASASAAGVDAAGLSEAAAASLPDRAGPASDPLLGSSAAIETVLGGAARRCGRLGAG